MSKTRIFCSLLLLLGLWAHTLRAQPGSIDHKAFTTARAMPFCKKTA